MRGRWRNFENKQSEKAIVGSACNPKMVSIEIMLWLLLAGITMSLSSCSGGEGESVPPPINFGPSISITLPTTDPTVSEVCNSELLSGDAGFGTSPSCCTGTTEELTGVKVTWTNATSGTSGQAFQSVQFCPIFMFCDHTWRATVPLVLCENLIRVTASDTATGAANTDTLTINKPALTYTASGTLRTVDQIGVGHFESGVTLQLSGDAANSIIPSSRSQAGNYAVSCLLNGNYTITPTTTNTFNYLFQPASHSFTVVGADVIDLDFQTTAYTVTGMISNTIGSPIGNRTVKISSGGIAWSSSQGETGTYRFVVPNGTYTVTPDPSCITCTFTPPTRTIVVNNASVSGQDFVLESL
jgi:hypothetical protein